MADDFDLDDDDTDDEFDQDAPTALGFGAPMRVPTSTLQSATLPGIRSTRQRLPDTPIEGAQPFFAAGSAPAAPASKQGLLRDLADQFMASTAETGADVVSFASLAARKLTENPEIVGWLEGQKRWLSDEAAAWVSSMSPEGQKAAHARLFGGGTDADGNHIPSPGEVGWARFVAHSITALIPAPVVAITGGGLAAAAVASLPVSAPVAAGVASTATAATLFGAMQSGGWYRGFVDTIDKAKPEQMMSSPVYAEAVKSGASDVDAKRLVVEQMMPFAAAQFVVGAAGGAAEMMLVRGATGAAGRPLADRLALGVAQGAAIEGAQGAAGDVLSQAALIETGLQKEYSPRSTLEETTVGALGGGVFGAVGGAIHRGRSPAGQAPREELLRLPPPDPIAADQKAALTEALALPKPRLALPPSSTTYGDGFTARATEPTPSIPLLTASRERGDGFTVNPPSTFAPPVDPQLTGPEARPALPAPDLARGTAGEGFTVSRSDSEPARPSGGMNRGRLIDELEQLGQDPKPLRRMPIGKLRDTYDQAIEAQSEGARKEFRPIDPQVRDVTTVPIAGEDGQRSADTPTNPASQTPAAPLAAARPQETAPAQVMPEQPLAALMVKPQTVSDKLKAKRQAEKARMAGPVMSLIKRDQAPAKKPEVVIEEDLDTTGRMEVESQPQIFESDAGTTTVVGEAEGGKDRSAQTTNKDRILGDLENKVANGLLTAIEADREYGRKTTAGGRDRRHPDLASYLKERIKQAEDPKVAQEIIERATRLQNDKTLTGPKRQAAVKAINEELARTDPNHIEKLRAALDELESPEAQAERETARQERKSTALDKLKALKAKKAERDLAPAGWDVADTDSDYVPLYDKRLNRPVNDLLAKSAPDGDSVHSYLDAIANDPVVKVRMPQAAALARNLKKHLLADLRVFTMKNAATHFNDPSFREPLAAGLYAPSEHIIALNDSRYSSVPPVEALLHEAVHAATVRMINRLPAKSREIQALDAISREIYAQMQVRGADTVEQFREIEYSLKNRKELVSMLMTNPTVQRFAAESTPSPAFRDAMSKLGYPLSSGIRSMWQSFTHWVRRVMGLPAQSESLLDYAMRPLQDIIEKGAKFNRENLPTHPELRRVAEPTLDAARHALPNFDDVRRTATDKIDPKGLSDKNRRFWLAGATTDGIVKWYNDLFKTETGNPLENYRKWSEAVAHRTKEFRDQYADRVHKLLDGIRGPDRDKLVSLMNDATLADVRIGAGADNTHIKDQAEVTRLQARYDALPPETKRTYNGLRDFYRETYEIERNAMLGSLIKTALPDATKAQVAALTAAAKTKRGIRQLIDNPDKSDVAAAFADAWDTNRTLVRGIAKIHSLGFVSGDYFPLRRYGDYVVHYGTKGTDDYGVEMFERRSQAETRRGELLKQGVEPSQVLDKREFKLRALIPTTVMDELDAAIRHSKGFTGEQADTARDLFASVLMQYASRSEAARTRLRRQGVKGASTDAERVLAQDFLALSSRIGWLDHGPDRAQAIAEMHRRADYLGRNGKDGEQIKAQAVVNELEKRMPSGDDASGELTHRARQFSTFGFVYSLLSPSQMIVNTFEAHSNSTALLGARHGYARAGLAVAKALGEISPKLIVTGGRNTIKAFGDGLRAADWNLANHARDRLIAAGADKAAMTDLFNRLNNAGLIDHSMVRELQRIANPGADVTKGWWGKFMDFSGAMNHAVDIANKSAIAKAAYDLEKRRSGHEQAVRYAIEQTRMAQPNYNLSNKPRIATDKGVLGAAAAPLMQFKMYGFHMYAVLANLTKASIHGASRQDRIEARRALAGILATRALMAGTLTLVPDPLRWMLGIYDWVTGAERPHSYDADMRAWISDAFGPELGEIVARGLPHAAGIDLQHRIGLSNMANLPELKSFDSKGYIEAIASAMTGAAGQDATKMAEGIGKIARGDFSKGLLDLIPVRAARDMLKAGMLNEKGVTDPKGKTILPREKLGVGDIAAQAVGFQPSRVSEFREGRSAVLQAREEMKTERGRLLTHYVTADPSDRTEVLADIQAYNRRNKTSPITYAQLVSALKRAREQVQNPKTFGLQLPKRAAPALTQEGRFVNVQ